MTTEPSIVERVSGSAETVTMQADEPSGCHTAAVRSSPPSLRRSAGQVGSTEAGLVTAATIAAALTVPVWSLLSWALRLYDDAKVCQGGPCPPSTMVVQGPPWTPFIGTVVVEVIIVGWALARFGAMPGANSGRSIPVAVGILVLALDPIYVVTALIPSFWSSVTLGTVLYAVSLPIVVRGLRGFSRRRRVVVALAASSSAAYLAFLILAAAL